jgi:hypothetical protein
MLLDHQKTKSYSKKIEIRVKKKQKTKPLKMLTPGAVLGSRAHGAVKTGFE